MRVVQKEESEGRNIIRVGWVWSIEGTTYQVRPSLTLTQTLTLTLTLTLTRLRTLTLTLTLTLTPTLTLTRLSCGTVARAGCERYTSTRCAFLTLTLTPNSSPSF